MTCKILELCHPAGVSSATVMDTIIALSSLPIFRILSLVNKYGTRWVLVVLDDPKFFRTLT